MGQILDFNAALTTKELEDYLASDEFDPTRRDKVLAGLNSSVEPFVAWLFPAAIITPRNARVGNIHGSPGSSLVIETHGHKRGVWKDFADPDQKGGNLIDLYMAARSLSFKDALDELAEWVGHGTKPEVSYQREQLVRRLKRVERDLGPQKGEWHYSDPDGSIIATVYRYEPTEGDKEFLPWDAVRGRYGNPDVRPLYNLPGILKSLSVVVCEGEKAAEALNKQGITATAVMGGCNSPLDRTDLEPLRGKEITIWPDADEPGRKFAAAFAQAVQDIALSVRILETPEGVEQGWDAWDAVNEGRELSDLLADPKVFDALTMSFSAFKPARFRPSDLDNIPLRRWVIGHRMQRGKVTGGVAPGGVGKSAFSLATAIAIVTGDPRLTGEKVHKTGPVLLIYNEEDRDEVNRRIAALCKYWRIRPEQLTDLHLMCNVSGEIKIVTIDKHGSAVVMPEVALIIEYCQRHGIIHICCDPFITFHTMPENDNTNVDIAARQFSKIAHDAQVSIDLIHHISKGGDSESHAGDISRARGAASIGAAIRNSYTLAAMSSTTASDLGIGPDYVRYVRFDDGKRNYALRSGEIVWFYLETVQIANGEDVGAIRPHDFTEEQKAKAVAAEEEANLAREQAVIDLFALMGADSVRLTDLSKSYGSQQTKTDRWARTVIEAAIPMAPQHLETHIGDRDYALWLERSGSSLTSPIIVCRKEL